MIREMRPEEYPLLEDFLYEAVFQPDETKLAPRSITKQPEMQVYIENFGEKPDDHCLCAQVGNRIVGAVWVRDIRGYGNVLNLERGQSTVPEFAISLYKEYRGQGIGTQLMKRMLEWLRREGYRKAVLAVQKENYARKMYLKTGFRIIGTTGEEYIMIIDF